MKKFVIKSFCKVNLSLRVVRKLNTGYHSIVSLITFCKLHDTISISKNCDSKDKIYFFGKFKRGINKRFNTITRVLNLLRKKKLIRNQTFNIEVKKNIPHGSGLGGGSSNAASLLNFFNKKMNLNLNKFFLNKLAIKVGSDVPVNLERKNSLLTGKNGEVIRLKNKFNFNLLIVYPNLVCSTKKIYSKNKIIKLFKFRSYAALKNKKKLIKILIRENNDLEKTVIRMYPRIKKLIDYIESIDGCYFSRITGSGSACIGLFSNMKNAVYAKKLIKLKYPKYWSVVSKTI